MTPGSEYYGFGDNVCKPFTSCLGHKLSRLASIGDEHRKLLARLEENPIRIERGTLLAKQSDPMSKLFILREGWVTSKTELPNGRSSIAFIHYPGDIVGYEDLPFVQYKRTHVAASNLVCCKLDRRDLEPLLQNSPRLSALFLAYGAIENAIVSDRLMISRRRDGEARLALFLLQTLARLRLMNDKIYNQFHLPLNQQEIGEIIGLTSVHVSRTFTKMEKLGLIARHRRFVRILNLEELAGLSNFEDRYSDLDLSWLPDK